MAKYSRKMVDQICSLIKKDCYTIAELCSLSGITRETYYAWRKSHPDFSDALTRAREDYDQLVVKEAKNSLMNKIRGYTVQETRTVMVDAGKSGPDGKPLPKIRERTVIEKHIQPDIQAIIFTLTNKAQEEYKIRQTTEVTGKDGKDLIPDRPLTMKEAKEFVEKLNREM
jgi:hypothetical protein